MLIFSGLTRARVREQRANAKARLATAAGLNATPLETASKLEAHSGERTREARDAIRRAGTWSVLSAFAGVLASAVLLAGSHIPPMLVTIIGGFGALAAFGGVVGAAQAVNNSVAHQEWDQFNKQDAWDVQAINYVLRRAQSIPPPAPGEHSNQAYRNASPTGSQGPGIGDSTSPASLFPEFEDTVPLGHELHRLIHAAANACQGNELLPNDAEWHEQTAWLRHLQCSVANRIDLREVPRNAMANMVQSIETMLEHVQVESVEETWLAWDFYTYENQHALLRHVRLRLEAKRQPIDAATDSEAAEPGS